MEIKKSLIFCLSLISFVVQAQSEAWPSQPSEPLPPYPPNFEGNFTEFENAENENNSSSLNPPAPGEGESGGEYTNNYPVFEAFNYTNGLSFQSNHTSVLCRNSWRR